MKRIRRPALPAEDLAELDRLVLHEFETLGRRVPSRHGTASPVTPPDAAAPATADSGRAARPAAREASSWDDDLGALEEPRPPANGAAPRPESLLSQEEDAFVQGAVQWLGQRPNRDDLIARIWAELTQGEPGAFYQAEADEGPTARAEAARDGEASGEPETQAP
jgi:hypothetical protein